MSVDGVLAADIGGTKMLAAWVDRAGRCAEVFETPTPAAEGAEAVLTALKALLKCAAEGQRPLAIGLSSAGVIDPVTAQVRDATDAMPGWKGTNFRSALAPEFGVPVQALNDVHAALVGEAWLGALKDQERGVMLTLGTGLGGAWMVDGRLQTGDSGVAGHWGRTRVPHQGEWVPLESLLSGQGLAYWHRFHGGHAQSGREVLAADPQDVAVVSAWRDWTQQLAALLHNLHWTMDPGIVVLGGGVIESSDRWWAQLVTALSDVPLRVKAADLGVRAGLLGAAREAWLLQGAA